MIQPLFQKKGTVDYKSKNFFCHCNFKYFTRKTPYIPLMLFDNPRMTPLIIEDDLGRTIHNSYLKIFSSMNYYSGNFLTAYRTSEVHKFGVGNGMLFYSYGDNDYVPIIMTVIPYHAFDNTKTWEDNLHHEKHNIEVFFHNNIRFINQTLWNYIRKDYIPLLQLEGLRFSFKSPEKIYELTTVSYGKPKFTSMEELTEYHKKMKSVVSFKNMTL